MDTFAPSAMAWAAALLVLAACWPLSQRWRHADQRPLAAYLVFASATILVAAAVFWGLVSLAGLLLPEPAGDSTVARIVVPILSFVPALIVARWLVRRPPKNRMPR